MTTSEDGTNGDEQEKAEERGFVIEVYLPDILRRDPAQVEPGLSIDDRYEVQGVETGEKFIFARDSHNQRVVILLKAGTATSENFTHILSVMASIRQEPVRGILAAYRFNPDVVHAARAVSNLLLQEYTHQVIFHDPTLDELDEDEDDVEHVPGAPAQNAINRSTKWEKVLARVKNPHVKEFFMSQIQNGKWEEHPSSSQIIYKVEGKRRFFVSARIKWAYVWQEGRIVTKERFDEEDENHDFELWKTDLSEKDYVRPVKNGKALRFRLVTAEDFKRFLEVLSLLETLSEDLPGFQFNDF